MRIKVHILTLAEYEDVKRRAYAAGLGAARAAVRNCEDGEYFPWVQVEIALAAIDTLSGEQ